MAYKIQLHLAHATKDKLDVMCKAYNLAARELVTQLLDGAWEAFIAMLDEQAKTVTAAAKEEQASEQPQG